MTGVWETQGLREGLEVWYLRKDITHATITFGIRFKEFDAEELVIPMALIKTIDDAYKYAIGRGYNLR